MWEHQAGWVFTLWLVRGGEQVHLLYLLFPVLSCSQFHCGMSNPPHLLALYSIGWPLE